MPMPQHDRPSPVIPLDRYRFVVGVDHQGKVQVYWPDGVTSSEALRACRLAEDYLVSVTQPQPARDQPSPHYRPSPRTPNRTTIED